MAVEALNYNPIIKLYRQLTPQMRTTWEKGHILSMKEVRLAKTFFDVRELRFWHLFSILAAYLRKNNSVFPKVLKVFNRMDSVVLQLPIFRLMAWQFTFEMHKQEA